ncbi:MAG: diguanylate cyclase [bacterium]|nr:diguanylate cyclase [bacterium]
MTGDDRDLLLRKIGGLEAENAMQAVTLAESRAMENALLNATSDLALIIDVRGTILEISDATASRIGRIPPEIINTCIYDYFTSEMVEFRKAYVNIVIQSRQFMNFEDQYGKTSLLVCIYPILDQSDEVERLAVFITDTTELKRNEMLLHRYSQILATINDPIAYIDKSFVYQTVNDATLKIYMKTRGEMVGKTVEDIVGKEVFEENFEPFILECIEGEKVYHQDWFDFPDGSRRYMYMSYYPLFAKDDIVSGVVINSIDVTKMKEMEEELKLLSQTDQLTQIFNRVKFHDSLTREVTRNRRYEADLSLIMFDIDHFKRVNDTYGHDVGDEVLITISEAVKSCIRETDIFARWGGEEFMLLLPHTSIKNAAKLAERIRKAIEETNFKTVGKVTSSFGVTQFVNSDNEEIFTKRVDMALYKAKSKGRNRVVAAQAKMMSVGPDSGG